MNGNLYHLYQAERFEDDQQADKRRLADIALARQRLIRTTMFSTALIVLSSLGLLIFFTLA